MQDELPLEPELEPSQEPSVTDFDIVETITSIDCAEIMARHMLRSALGKTKRPVAHGLYIVQTPSEEWCTVLKEVVGTVYGGNLGDTDNGKRTRRKADTHFQAIHVFDPPSTAEPKETDRLNGKIQDLLALGRAVVIITSNLAAIPALLQRASDQIFTVPPPRRQFVSALLREITPGSRRVNLAGLACDRLTPLILRLAYRRGTNANVFLQRLRMLTSPVPAHDSGGKSMPLDRLHGVDEAKNWAMDLKADLARYRRGELPWRQLTRGLLLAGPPGTAKTTLAHSMADFCGLAFVSCSYAAWQRSNDGHLGEVLKAMAASFAEARSRQPALLFIDELDSLGARNQRSQRDDWWRSVINALLEQMDGSDGNEGLIFVGASNHPDLIDPAILRSGRMEDRITLHPPSADALAKIYRDQLEGEIDDLVDLRQIGRISAGLTGADVVKACNTARRRARNSGRLVNFDDLLVAITAKGPHTDPEFQHRIAVHEAGHAVIAISLPELQLDHVSIVGHGNKGGSTSMRLGTKALVTQAAISAHLTAILGGRAAEEILLGEISAGAGGSEGSDLSHATQLAASAELSLGMREQGLIWHAPPTVEKLSNLFAKRPDLERTVQARLDQAYDRARALVRAKAPLVRRLAEQLLIDRVLTGAEAEVVIQEITRADPPPTNLEKQNTLPY